MKEILRAIPLDFQEADLPTGVPRRLEIAALNEAMSAYGLASSIVVTRDEDEQIDIPAGRVTVVPAWRFLLQMPEY